MMGREIRLLYLINAKFVQFKSVIRKYFEIDGSLNIGKSNYNMCKAV